MEIVERQQTCSDVSLNTLLHELQNETESVNHNDMFGHRSGRTSCWCHTC